jgi:hypothetical protein
MWPWLEHLCVTPSGDGEPGFHDTVGRWQQWQDPKIIVFALPTEIGFRMLNQKG